jgi:integrase
MKMTKLTPAAARDLPPKKELRDHEVKGLILCAGVEGKSWRLYYRTRAGTERKPRIGSFPEMSLSRAREVAKELKERVAKGEDPSADWKASKAVPTVAQLSDRYIDDWAPKRMNEASLAQHKQLIEVQIKPGLGSKKVTEVTSNDVDEFLDDVYHRKFVPKDNRGPTAHWTAKHTKNCLSMIFKRLKKLYGVKLEDDPFEDTKSYERIRRKRHAKPEEIVKISTALGQLADDKPLCAACIWTIFLTGGRVTEIVMLRADQIEVDDKGQSVIKLEKHKTYRRTGDKRVVLPPQAMAIIAKLPAATGDARVFGELKRRYIEKVWEGIRTEAGCPDLKLLDGRRTFASFGLSYGLSLEQVGELLGHTHAQTTKDYSYLIEELKQRSAGMIANAIVNAGQQGESRAPAK